MKKLKTYLAGSIQALSDGGADWREKVGVTLSELGIDVLDPVKAECNHTLADNILDQKKKLENLKRGGEWERYKLQMRDIRKNDLACVLQSDFIVLSYNPTIVVGGTLHEIVVALENKIPIYTVTYEPLVKANDWTLSLLLESVDHDKGKILHNFKQLVNFVEIEYRDYIAKYKEFIRVQESKLKEVPPIEEPKK